MAEDRNRQLEEEDDAMIRAFIIPVAATAAIVLAGCETVYTGLIEQVKPSDDELAAVIGHEMGHALREHGRERASQQMAEQAAIGIIGAIANVPQGALDLAPMVFDLTVNLPHSRQDETEA